MSELKDIVRELDKIEEQEKDLEQMLRAIRLRKMQLHIHMMMTPEARKAYREAYEKIRRGEVEG